MNPSFDSLLSNLNREQLQLLLLKLVERDPSLVEIIEGQVDMLRSVSSKATPTSPMAAPPRHTEVDVKAVRRQVRSIIHGLDRMRSSEAYWHVGAVGNGVRQLVEQAWSLIKADDGRNAQRVVEIGRAHV